MGNGIKTCQEMCRDGVPEDCVINEDDEARSADNYVCIAGACYYEGCNIDEECGAGYQCAEID